MFNFASWEVCVYREWPLDIQCCSGSERPCREMLGESISKGGIPVLQWNSWFHWFQTIAPVWPLLLVLMGSHGGPYPSYSSWTSHVCFHDIVRVSWRNALPGSLLSTDYARGTRHRRFDKEHYSDKTTSIRDSRANCCLRMFNRKSWRTDVILIPYPLNWKAVGSGRGLLWTKIED